MSTSQFTRRLIAGLIGCGLLALLLGLLDGPELNLSWRNLKSGMTQQEVRRVLGDPTWSGQAEAIGAGDQHVTRWEYKRGHWIYCVDFDYIGPGGIPVVYRTECYKQDWEWPSWWPLKPAPTRG